MKLDKWQEDALEHRGNILLCTGRQIGKTTVLAIKAATRMIEKPNTRIIVASLTEDQAKLIIVMILDYLQKKWKKNIAKGKNKPTLNKIILTNKSSVIARPVGLTGESVRGFTADILILDEVSRFKEIIMEAAKPTLASTGGEIWLASTPAGKQGYFWDTFNNEDSGFKVIHISTETAYRTRPLSIEWTEERRTKALKFLESEKKAMTALQFGQEYEGLFLEDLQRFFTDDLITENSVLSPSMNSVSGVYYLGVDVARLGGDETTFEIIEKQGDMYFHKANHTKIKVRIDETVSIIEQLHEQWKFKKIYIDPNGVGGGVLDYLLKNPRTKDKVIGLDNASKSISADDKNKKRILKEDMYFNFKSLLEQGRLKLLKEDKVIKSMESIQYEITESGKYKIFGNYSHIVEGLIRACWAEKDKTLKLWAAYNVYGRNY